MSDGMDVCRLIVEIAELVILGFFLHRLFCGRRWCWLVPRGCVTRSGREFRIGCVEDESGREMSRLLVFDNCGENIWFSSFGKLVLDCD